ncbi:MAG: purine-nucleoside phosphorylase [Spirochaetales bacterium]|nr:purine-nucleoside phosphorylase [Spirochaetales bacterium]
MSIHMGAKKGDIAPAILLPGDPLRAKFIAEKWLENPVCYTEVRGMYGYTGTYKGKRISVQGTGMGLPSHSIYVHELINMYDVQTLIRVGSCGAMQPDLKLRDIILAQASSTDSAINKQRFHGMDFAPIADFGLLKTAYEKAGEKGMNVSVGNVLSSDVFYADDPEGWKLWAEYGVLAAEMESSALYSLAAKFNRKALTILTVSDSIVSHQETTSEEREKTFTDMIEIALDTALTTL